jgi:hypothetical protein
VNALDEGLKVPLTIDGARTLSSALYVQRTVEVEVLSPLCATASGMLTRLALDVDAMQDPVANGSLTVRITLVVSWGEADYVSDITMPADVASASTWIEQDGTLYLCLNSGDVKIRLVEDVDDPGAYPDGDPEALSTTR